MLTVTYVFKGGPAHGKILPVLADELPDVFGIEHVDWKVGYTEDAPIEVKRTTYRVACACKRAPDNVAALCITEQDWRLRSRTWIDLCSGEVEDWMSFAVREFETLYGGPQVFDEERSLRVGTPKERD